MRTYIDSCGYVRLQIKRTPAGDTNILLHRKVWLDHHGSIPAGRNIHHKDGNKRNNEIENLALQDTVSHSRLYFDWYRLDDGTWLKFCPKCGIHKPLAKFYSRTSHISDSVNSYCISCSSIMSRSEISRERNRRYNRRPEIRKSRADKYQRAVAGIPRRRYVKSGKYSKKEVMPNGFGRLSNAEHRESGNGEGCDCA